MSWHKFLGSVVLIGAVAGCEAFGESQSRQSVAAEKPAEPTPLVPRSKSPEGDGVKPASHSTLLNEAPDPGSGRLIATIRATVNGVPILDQDVRAVAPPNANADDLKKALDMLIERELVLQDCYAHFNKGPGAKFLDRLKEEASKQFDRNVVVKTKKKLNLKSDEEFKTFIKSQGLTVEALRKQWERQFLFQQYVQFKVGPAMDRIGHEEIRDYFDAHPEKFENSDSVHWQDIFVAASNYANRETARRTAEQVLAKMRQGEDIAALMPLDNGDSTLRQGDGLGRKHGEIRPVEVEAVLFKMKEKEAAIVELAGGYHVVRVIEREFAGQMPFDEKVQNTIRDDLKNEAFSREAKQFVNTLKQKATIEIAQDRP